MELVFPRHSRHVPVLDLSPLLYGVSNFPKPVVIFNCPYHWLPSPIVFLLLSSESDIFLFPLPHPWQPCFSVTVHLTSAWTRRKILSREWNCLLVCLSVCSHKIINGTKRENGLRLRSQPRRMSATPGDDWKSGEPCTQSLPMDLPGTRPAMSISSFGYTSAKLMVWFIAFNPNANSVGKALLLLPLHSWGNWEVKQLCKLSSRAGVRLKISILSDLGSLLLCSLF